MTVSAASIALALLVASEPRPEEAPAIEAEEVPAAEALQAPDEAPASDEEPAAQDVPAPEDRTVVRQKRRDIFKTGGSVRLLEEEQLEATNYDDPHSVLGQVPGVYLRTEDGYGLRPNIGLRGVSPERSVKVTLMEDGLLFGPAPYAAPAAYYFPLMTRMVGVEVTKGPASVRFGPNTIGGAIDYLTRSVPKRTEGAVDLAVGTAADLFDNVYAKLHAHAGTSWGWGGALAEVVHLETTGFKQLDLAPDANTGFSRTEVMLKLRADTPIVDDTTHRFDLKAGYSREISHETYLGLSDADLRADPYRRYVASELDRMAWERWQLELGHRFASSGFELETRLYTHLFDRTWRRLNRFRDGPSLSEILADPEGIETSVYYRVLTGLDDSSSLAESLMVADNHRTFAAYGAQTQARLRLVTGRLKHKVELGVRLHADEVVREHIETGYAVADERLVRDALPPQTSLHNDAQALALATHLLYALSGYGLTVVPGLRVEVIDMSFGDRLADRRVDGDQLVLLPGVGLHYTLTDRLGLLAGVYRGFSPVAPGQDDAVRPESSVNYEAGVRWLDADSGSFAEVVGFYGDYTNLVGQCSQSSGCDEASADDQYNGGAVEVMGVEVAAAHTLTWSCWRFPMRLAYTFTRGEFQTSFESDDVIFGDVKAGDGLPYVPPHQLMAQVGFGQARWSVLAAYTFIDVMREKPGRGEVPGEMTDAVHFLDLMADVRLGERVTLYARGENVFDHVAIGSRRPFGARPVKPRMLQLGVKLSL